MAIPQKLGDRPIKFGDTGPDVLAVQRFLVKQPFYIKEQKFLSDFDSNRTEDLLDGNNASKFLSATHKALFTYQRINEARIRKIGNLNAQEWEKEKGQISSATAKIMIEDGLIPGSSPQPSQLKQPQNAAPQVPEVDPLPDPPAATGNMEANSYVQTRDFDGGRAHRLAARLDVAHEEVGKEVWESTDAKGKLQIMMPQGSLLKVITPHIGYRCRWHEIKIVDDNPLFNEVREFQKENRLFCYAEFVQPLKGTKPFLAVNCMKCNDEVTELPDEWWELDDCEPIATECYYYITVETQDTSTDEMLLPAQKKDALFIGINKLLIYYDKQRSVEDIERYMNAFEFAEVPEDGWYLDERPGSKMKFLVRIPTKYFDAIPQDTDRLDDIVTNETINGPASGWRTTHFYTSDLRTNLDIVVKRFEEYGNDINSWQGDVVDIDIFSESRRLESFFSRLVEFLDINGYEFRTDEDDSIEIGFEGPCFKIMYVLLSQDGLVAKPLRIGFDCFVASDPIRFERTMGYIFYLEEMVKEIKRGKTPWMQFIQRYSCPIPEIVPSYRPVEKKKEKFDFDKPFKNVDEKDEEDALLTIGRKAKLAKERAKEFDFVGDNLLDCENIPDMLNRIGNIDDLYTEVLNKVDIKNVAATMAACLGIKIPRIDLLNIICKTIFKRLPTEELQVLLDFLPPEELVNIRGGLVNVDGALNANKFREVIETFSSPESICKAINELDPERVAIEIRELLEFNLDEKISQLRPPTIFLPDSFPTEDIMRWISEFIINAVQQALTKALMAVIKKIFESLCELCVDTPSIEEQYGDENINDILDKDPNDIAKDFKIPPKAFPTGDIKDFLDDLSELLLPSELCRLIDGVASQKTIKIIKNFILSRYQSLVPYLFDETRLKNFFKLIGRNIDPKVCEQILANREISHDNFCDDNNKIVRCSLLKGRMSENQLKEQMERIREQNRRKLESFIDASKGDILRDAFPTELNKCGSRFLTRTPPSLEHLNDRVITSMFESVGMAFDTDIQGFILSMVQYVDEKARKDQQKTHEEQADSRDAHFKMMEAKDGEKFTEEDAAAVLKDPFMGSISKGSTEVVPNLKDALNKPENFIIKETTRETAFSFKGKDKNLIDYYIPFYNGEDIKERYEMSTKNVCIDHKSEMKQYITNHGELAQDTSIPQNIFSNFVINKIKNKIEFSDEKQAKDFFKNDVFNNITTYVVNKVARQITNSPLFTIDGIQKLDLSDGKTDKTKNVCMPEQNTDNLLNLSAITEKVKNKYEKNEESCVEGNKSLENASSGGVVETLIRLYVIDYILRGSFTFSEFKVSDTFGDGTVVDYLINKIKNSLKGQEPELYKVIAALARELVLERGSSLIDPFETDPQAKPEEKLVNEIHPDYQSGEAFIEFLIKEQIKDFSEEFEKAIGTNTEGIQSWIMNYIPVGGVFYITEEVDNYASSRGINRDEGFLAIQRYKRDCLGKHNGTETRVTRPDDFMPSGTDENEFNLSYPDYKYGVRLVYIQRKNPKINLTSVTNKKEEKIILSGEESQTYVIPLIEIEEDEYKAYDPNKEVYKTDTGYSVGVARSLSELHNTLFTSLERKMIASDDFKLLFSYIYPMQRFISLLTIYCIEFVSDEIKNIDNNFLGTRNSLKILLNAIQQAADDEWWLKTDPDIEAAGGNIGIRKERMGNIDVDGTHPSLASLAAMTIPLIIKGFASYQDPCYRLIESTGLNKNWGSVPAVLPVNIFGVPPFGIGIGPPLGLFGALALSIPELPGEKKKRQQKEIEKQMEENIDNGGIKDTCEDKENK